VITTDVAVAVACLRDGALVGLVTETVYGLAADAERASAVARIYAAKGRPADHPLIVHVADAGALRGPHAWAREVPQYALRLAEGLWPGPLTLVLRRSSRAGGAVTAGLDTVGLRAPSHPVTRRVLTEFAAATGRPGAGLAAPSANRFGRLSPTTAGHVLTELGGQLREGVDCVLDGGPCPVGVESTIVDCTRAAPAVLRPGAIGREDLERIGGVRLDDSDDGSGNSGGSSRSRPRAPGTLAAHYAPRALVVLADRGADASTGDGLLALAEVPSPPGVVRLAAPDDAPDYARALYAALREADALGLSRVVAVPPGPAGHPGLAEAIRDRLMRAAAAPAESR
jgi:L-threonylcarbamoyladenylate synthase